MNVEALNAVARERARIREGVTKLIEKKSIVAGFFEEQAVNWIPAGEVLAILSENQIKPEQVLVKCACEKHDKTEGRFHGKIVGGPLDGMSMSIGYIAKHLTDEEIDAIVDANDHDQYLEIHPEGTWPLQGSKFYRLNSLGDVIEAPWTGSQKQKKLLEYGNIFETRELAEKAKEKIIEVFTFNGHE